MLKTIGAAYHRAFLFTRRFLRSAWRPALGWMVFAIGMANVYVAVTSKQMPDLSHLALLVTAIQPLVIARTIEKLKGVSDNG